ncbi:MAG: PaaX family transcriptional regulator C-terminal domain-containing protein, partial [Pseudomonadota bacterium]
MPTDPAGSAAPALTDGPRADRQIDALLALGDLRVWSVVITVFGDSIQPRGGIVAATTLAQILGRMRVRPEALRVALHRLVRDGWLDRWQEGRRSFYRLSDSGVARFAPATRRIYADGPALTGPWRLLVAAPGAPEASAGAPSDDIADGGVLLGPGLCLAPSGAAPPPPGWLAVDGTVAGVPGWARSAIAPAPLCAEYARLETALAGLAADLAEGPAPAPLDAIVLRSLVVHRWRRLLLRHADLPAAFFPDGWRGEACRAHVRRLHTWLSAPAETWLSAT